MLLSPLDTMAMVSNQAEPPDLLTRVVEAVEGNLDRVVDSMMTAYRSGTYAVYPSNSFNPLMRVHLSRGDQYGFTKREDKVYAVAAGQETPLGALTATSYYWKYQPGGE